MNINLIGMRGVGKSNVARRLSVLTKRPVMSTDVLLEYESGMGLPQFVAARGWRAFRDLEFDIIARLAELDGLIVDCGGGALIDLDSAGDEIYSARKVQLLRDGGPIVYLAGDIPRLAAKTASDPTRPVIDPALSAEAIMRRREPFYVSAADWTIMVERDTRQQAAEAIAARYPE